MADEETDEQRKERLANWDEAERREKTLLADIATNGRGGEELLVGSEAREAKLKAAREGSEQYEKDRQQ